MGDRNPAEIECIAVVREPSAPTRYGTDAANGVIGIRTKRGAAGRPLWLSDAEQTAFQDRSAVPRGRVATYILGVARGQSHRYGS